jgi:hypothetical protein
MQFENLPLFAHRSQSHVVMLTRYNTELRQVFPLQNDVIWNLLGACFGCVQIFFSRAGNDVRGKRVLSS